MERATQAVLNIRSQYVGLTEDIQRALCSRVGNVNELRLERARVILFLEHARPVCFLPPSLFVYGFRFSASTLVGLGSLSGVHLPQAFSA